MVQYTPDKVEAKITNVFNPKTGKIETKTEEVVTPGKQEIIVGSKDYTGVFTHDVTEEVPYEMEVIEDDTLEAGKEVVDQEGKAGSKTTTYTQASKNGQADGALKSKVKSETKPQKRIVRVGKKLTPNTCPLIPATETKVNKDIPVEIEYVNDDKLEKGKVETGTLTPGKVETKVVSKVVDGKVVNTEETVVTPAKQIIKVGTKITEDTCKLPNAAENPTGMPGEPETPETPDQPDEVTTNYLENLN